MGTSRIRPRHRSPEGQTEPGAGRILRRDLPTDRESLEHYGLGRGVGRGRGVGPDRGVGVGLGVVVTVAVGVAVAVGVGVGPPLGDTRTK